MARKSELTRKPRGRIWLQWSEYCRGEANNNCRSFILINYRVFLYTVSVNVLKCYNLCFEWLSWSSETSFIQPVSLSQCQSVVELWTWSTRYCLTLMSSSEVFSYNNCRVKPIVFLQHVSLVYVTCNMSCSSFVTGYHSFSIELYNGSISALLYCIHSILEEVYCANNAGFMTLTSILLSFHVIIIWVSAWIMLSHNNSYNPCFYSISQLLLTVGF